MVKIKHIQGALVEKKKESKEKSTTLTATCGCGPDGGCGCSIDDFNEAIDQQGEVEITLNRERLARICHKNSGYGRGFGRKFDLMCASDQEVFYSEADAIIAQESTLLERKT